MKATILLVEDNADNRAIYSTILQHFGYRVEEVASGEDALGAARNVRPDLILLDISLPGMDGWTVAEQLKGERTTRDIILVALTAHALPEDYRRSEELGFDGFLAKPVRPRRVAEEIARLLQARREASGAEARGGDPDRPPGSH